VSKQKVVIIGGVAGGATAAARIMRLDNSSEVTVIERSPDVSFANCGLPYYIGNEIKDRHKLALQTPESLSVSLGIKVLTNTSAVKIDRKNKLVSIVDKNGTSALPYDKLVFSPGASPLRPANIEGIDNSKILTLRNLQDMDFINAVVKAPGCKSVAVIGAGFIGLEMVEQLHRIGKTVHLVEKSQAVLPQADEDMAEFLQSTVIENGVHVHVNDGLQRFEDLGDKVAVHLSSGAKIEADVVILSIGVKPESHLAKDSGLALNARGYVITNEYMQTSDPEIYAVGDVVETTDLVFPEKRATVALGNIANMQARIAADHLTTGKSIAYSGSLGTSIVRAFDMVLALTGWNEKRLNADKIPYEKVVVTDYHHASYYPGAVPLTLKVLFDKATGRIYGAQAVGLQG
jgi:NADPH-dependent 2,4-dienoyl-CoA reductase/sulfur reductase-like enzyme